MIRVAMVEDHPIVQAGLARIVSSAPDLTLISAVERIEHLPLFKEPPDVVLLDLHLPSPLQGLAGVKHMADRGFRILVVTGEDTGMDEVADAMAAGAQGYLTKHAAAEEYVIAIRAVAAGRGYIGARLAAFFRRDSAKLAANDPNRLTARESDVAGLLVEGYTNAEIAQIIKLSERTIDGHVENIKQKLCESRRVRVAIKLKELGYQPPPGYRREEGA